jgi:hypothetical protein
MWRIVGFGPTSQKTAILIRGVQKYIDIEIFETKESRIERNLLLRITKIGLRKTKTN